MKLWQKLWLLFTVIWTTVAALNVGAILFLGEDVDPVKASWPAFFAIVVPAAAYAVGWLWDRYLK